MVHARELSADNVLEEALDIVRPLASRKGMAVSFTAEGSSTELETDRLKLRQILVNLVTNAIKYSDGGEVVVTVRRAESGTGERVLFEVADSGRGISLTDQAHIFEAFWQADQALNRSSHGTGLGLAVARQLARLLGGDVTIARSEPGRGSVFLIDLPRHFPAS